MLKMTSNKWDIFSLDDDEGWSHLQIQQRLAKEGIECIVADIWGNENMAYLVGCDTHNKLRIAMALNINEECVYVDDLHGLIIINLFQEKYLRGML